MLKYFILSQIFLSFIFIFIILLGISFLTLWERKLLAGIQRRQGPVYVGILGLLQPFADGLKLLSKTFNFPAGGYYHVFLGSSVFSLALSLLAWTIIPFNSYFSFAEVNCSLLLILLISSLNKYTILFSGWSSNSKYGVLGSIRSGAQMASYEIPMLMSLLPIIFLSSTLNLINVVYFQINFFWFIIFVPNALMFFICLLAETNRTPFDLPEAESELVAGYNIEYSSMSFAVFFLAEYNHILVASFLFSLLFLGGWDSFGLFKNQFFFLLIKSFVILNLIIYMRGILPRYKFTDLITICWQAFIPMSIVVFLTVWTISTKVIAYISELLYNYSAWMLTWILTYKREISYDGWLFDLSWTDTLATIHFDQTLYFFQSPWNSELFTAVFFTIFCAIFVVILLYFWEVFFEYNYNLSFVETFFSYFKHEEDMEENFYNEVFNQADSISVFSRNYFSRNFEHYLFDVLNRTPLDELDDNILDCIVSLNKNNNYVEMLSDYYIDRVIGESIGEKVIAKTDGFNAPFMSYIELFSRLQNIQFEIDLIWAENVIFCMKNDISNIQFSLPDVDFRDNVFEALAYEAINGDYIDYVYKEDGTVEVK